jgi:hypothetical protein
MQNSSRSSSPQEPANAGLYFLLIFTNKIHAIAIQYCSGNSYAVFMGTKKRQR